MVHKLVEILTIGNDDFCVKGGSLRTFRVYNVKTPPYTPSRFAQDGLAQLIEKI